MKKSLSIIFILFFLCTLTFSSEGFSITNNTTENEDVRIKLSSSFIFQVYKDELIVSTIVMEILNKSKSPIKIIWDETVMTDNYNYESGVIHEGTKYVNKNESQVPTIILPKKTLKDSIIPKTHISWKNDEDFDGWYIEPYNIFLNKRILFLTYEMNNERKNIMLEFEISNISNKENDRTILENDKTTNETDKETNLPKEDKEIKMKEDPSLTLVIESEDNSKSQTSEVVSENNIESKNKTYFAFSEIQETFRNEIIAALEKDKDKIKVSFENISSQPIIIEWEYNRFKNKDNEIVASFPMKTKILFPNETVENEILYNDDFEEFYFEYKMGTSKKTGNIKLYENEKLNSDVVQSKENDPIKKTFYEEEQPKQSWFEENKKTILISAGVGFGVAITTIFTVMLLNSN